MQLIETTEFAPQDWAAFVTRSPNAAAYHDPRWLELFARVFSVKTYFVSARNAQGGLLGGLPLVLQSSLPFGRYMTSLPFVNYGGPLAQSGEVTSRLASAAAELAQTHRARHLELRTFEADVLGWPQRIDKVTMILSLPDSAEALSKQLGAKLRSQIKRMDRESPRIRIGGVELVNDFYGVFAVNMRELGTPVYSRSFFREILTSFADEARIVVVERGAQPVAAGLVYQHRDCMEIPWAACLAEQKRVGANMRLYWECLKLAIERGARRFDFGRCTRDSGTFRFKKQWGAEPTQLYWHYWLAEGRNVPQMHHGNKRLGLAIRAWQKMPLAACNWLGPKIVRNLP